MLSVAISHGRGIRINPPEPLAQFAGARVLGIPIMTVAVLALPAAMVIVPSRTGYGRSVPAVGQSMIRKSGPAFATKSCSSF